LDEIGDLPLSGQVKLLRVLEAGEFQALGSSKTRTTRVRVVSATNADLSALIRDGRFREDLYYRLNVIEIALPSLAERRADILPLARHFLGSAWRMSEDAEAALLAHDWPGNVRELRNSIERAKLLARESGVTAADLNLPASHRGAPQGDTNRRAAEPGNARADRDVEQPSRELIEASLRETGGNISRAAQSLGLSRQALYRRMERFNLRP
jgi:DNA-binding NtrC family response regulator